MYFAILLALVGFGISYKEDDKNALFNELNFPVGAAFPEEGALLRFDPVKSDSREDVKGHAEELNPEATLKKIENANVRKIDIDDLGDIHPFWSNAGHFGSFSKNELLLEDYKKWDEPKKFPNLRFRVKKVELRSETTPEVVNQLGKSAQFTKDKTRLVWEQQNANAVSIFRKLTQIFNVNSFELDEWYGITSEMDKELVWLPEFQRLESVSLPSGTLQDEILLKLQARTIFTEKLASHPQIYPTVNQFFKQWYEKERNISIVAIRAENGENMTNAVEALLHGLPYSSVWSYEDHYKSIFSELPKEQAYEFPENGAIYMVDRGDKNLIIMLAAESVAAVEAKDEKKFLAKYIFRQDSEYEWENAPGFEDDDDY